MAKRKATVSIIFMSVWIVFWLAGILVVVVSLGGQMLEGDFAAAPFLLIWLAAAGFGLYMGGRKIVKLVRFGSGSRPRGTAARHQWNDGTVQRPAESDTPDS